ncbi:MAG: Na/Pi symporter [Bacteroidia bacterium]|jgi:phosphate:Na+ symporter|nr:Na/Pi symporter [Bacteroidia bacterium]
MTEILLSILAGLVLFLYAVSSLSDTIQKAVGENSKKWILKFTKNTFTGILTGIVVTTLLDSSSAVIIITIIFVNAKLLTFRQAMGIVLGANIGTTISSQIIAMDVGKYAPVLLLVGFVLLVVSKSDKINNAGKVILYFGVLFFGLFTMENAVEPLRDEPYFLEWLRKTEDPVTGSLIGALVTLVIQSSSATVGMAIILSKKGLIGLSGGIAVMLGAELGTCSDTLMATIKGSRQAIKTGLFHLVFNILSISLGLVFFQPFLFFINELSGKAPIERAVANAHVVFNFAGVLLFMWTIPMFEYLLNKLLPDKKEI